MENASRLGFGDALGTFGPLDNFAPAPIVRPHGKVVGALRGRSDSECRREEGVKLMNLEKFIEVNNFMPVPPQKPPTAQHLSSSFAPGLPPSRLPEQRLASKFVNLSVDAHANYSEDPPSSYPRGGVELALQMYAPQPSMRLKRDSRRNSISSESEEAKKKTSLPNSGLATPSIASVTPTALFRNTPLATLPSTVKKVVSTQPTSRSASMNLSRGTDRGLP